MKPTENEAKAARVPVTGSKDWKKTLLKIRAGGGAESMNCPHCHRPLIEIEYYGDLLIGCTDSSLGA